MQCKAKVCQNPVCKYNIHWPKGHLSFSHVQFDLNNTQFKVEDNKASRRDKILITDMFVQLTMS